MTPEQVKPGMDELLPCPFCGSRAHIYYGLNQYQNKTIGISCKKCLAYVGKVYTCEATKNLVVEQWNRRAPADNKDAPPAGPDEA